MAITRLIPRFTLRPALLVAVEGRRQSQLAVLLAAGNRSKVAYARGFVQSPAVAIGRESRRRETDSWAQLPTVEVCRRLVAW